MGMKGCFKSLSLTLIMSTLLLGCITAWFQEDFNHQAWNSVLKGDHRSKVNKERDKHRHPKATLDFFQLQPNQVVVEIWPASGWYTEILAPLLFTRGTLYTAHFDKDSQMEFFQRSRMAFLEKVQAFPDKFSRVKITEFAPPKKIDVAPKNSADRVFTFRNIHNWMRSQQELNAFKAFYDTLKPDGLLGVVEHRAQAGTTRAQMVKSGYVTEAFVIKTARSAGFELVAKSNINANPRDTKDHPQGVWTLPPTLRLANQNRTYYLNIGESDRMTLLFKKQKNK
jgi:predicted methyltransferase